MFASTSISAAANVSLLLSVMISLLIYHSVFVGVAFTQFQLFSPHIDRQPSTTLKLSSAPNDELTESKSWRRHALEQLWEERAKMGRTPVFPFKYTGNPRVTLLFKNETATSTGSLKHRYAWALMTWALLEGHVKQGTHVYEASSGNTAASLAFMCRLIGVPFTAIVPDTLEDVKKEHIEHYGGQIVKVPIAERLVKARELADKSNGFFMNQFGNAFLAEEFHESGNYEKQSANMFHEIVTQLNESRLAIPDYFVHAAGTGGTITSIGRYIKKYNLDTQVVFADTQFSVYYDYVLHNRFANQSGSHLWVEPGMAGIGFGPMGPAKKGQTTSLDPAVIDRVLKIPDCASTAAMKVLLENGVSGGTSSGVNLVAALHIGANLSSPRPVTIATILGDPSSYYQTSYLNRDWIAQRFARHGGLEAYYCWISVLREALDNGKDPLQLGRRCPTGNV
ncbi:unnamed protein product [Caenorhabditis auriculariae]|uniref:Tryptophan synthase beta chain-like PALP domain-containing protein n=1 Tax=Caenorhabditis auriculariae TaxID=2777116 RepID=A0A8S1H7I8_9PELO|nr:unnamed protein product [Caenorhabditis auriculariae]